MKIIVHDYAGHPYQVELGRRLAARGHHVIHYYCASTHTPLGELPGFSAAAVKLAESPALRDQSGRAARQYADAHFDVDRIADRFEQILRGHRGCRC